MTNDALRAEIRKLGTMITPQIVSECMTIYARRLNEPDPNRIAVDRDIAYGPHPRHRLDIYGGNDGDDRPVLLYVHGGGFIGGDKILLDTPFYGNIGAWAADQGFVGVVMTYRLAPDHQWPAGAEDVGMAIRWLRRNLGDHGSATKHIFVAGQSAGATHVAGYLATRDLHDADAPVAGALLFSGLYDLTFLDKGPLEHHYFGRDDSLAERQSSLTGLIDSAIPLLFTIAEHDPPNFQAQAVNLVERWFAAKGTMPRLLYLPDANHMSAALGIGSAEKYLTSEIAEFIHRFAGT